MSTPINDGGPAFPEEGPRVPGFFQSGMSLRDWFAGQALAGMLADTERSGKAADYAKQAFEFSDSMLAARDKRP